MSKIISEIENEQLKKSVPDFAAGDTVVVQVKVKEGNRERLQAFEGVVIAIRNRGLNSSFTVRKISHGEGVERVFQTHSPLVDSVKVVRRGHVRRAKLYYLRERSGRSARIRQKIERGNNGEAAAEVAPVEAPVETVEQKETETKAAPAKKTTAKKPAAKTTTAKKPAARKTTAKKETKATAEKAKTEKAKKPAKKAEE